MAERLSILCNLEEYELTYIERSFSQNTRLAIFQRDGYACLVCHTTHNIEACHVNHKKGNGYDLASNGMTLCTEDHLQDHIQREGDNGLTISQNEYAIRQISDRLAGQLVYQNGDRRNGHKQLKMF